MEKCLEGPVLLEITGGQGEIVNRHEGQCYYRNGHHFILFREELPQDDGRSVTAFSSRLKISEDQVTLRRSLPGEEGANAVMEFVYRVQEPKEPGCLVHYPTPYGVMDLEFMTKELRIEKRTGGMELYIRYVARQAGQEMIRDELKIMLRQK